jgi:hypothetical protein
VTDEHSGNVSIGTPCWICGRPTAYYAPCMSPAHPECRVGAWNWTRPVGPWPVLLQLVPIRLLDHGDTLRLMTNDPESAVCDLSDHEARQLVQALEGWLTARTARIERDLRDRAKGGAP